MQITCNSLQNSSTLASILSDCWPSAENSTKSERIMQISHISPIVPMNYAKFTKSTPMASELQENTANHQNSAQSAPAPGEHCKFHAFGTQQKGKLHIFTHLLHIIHRYAHIFLHTCRLVLDAYFLNSTFAFNIKFLCIIPTCKSFQDHYFHTHWPQ